MIARPYNYCRRIHFEGNSLTALDSNSNTVNGQYVAQTAYNTIAASRNNVSIVSFAVSGRTSTQINAAMGTQILASIQPRDAVIYWEGTNEMQVNGTSAADAFALVVTYRNGIWSYSPSLYICTVAARDLAGDDADLMTRIDAYNVLVRNNASTYGYTVVDIGGMPEFDTRADASNTTYYKADKIHMTTAGQNLAAGKMSTAYLL